MSVFLDRHAALRLSKLLASFPVVALTGARQVGKTTIVQKLAREMGGVYLTLDDLLTRTRALEDPQGLVEGVGEMLVIDEIQLAPRLLQAIKRTVDQDRRPGRFLITGSANLLGMRTVTESLAGRSAWFELAPLTWSELVKAPCPQVLTAAFSAKNAAEFVANIPHRGTPFADEARERVVRGGMPPTLTMDDDIRREWYAGYRKTFLERDLRQLSQIENLPEFNRLLSLTLLRTGRLLNKNDLAADAGLSHPSVRRYLNLLEVAYQIFELSPYFANLGKRLVKSPKIYAVDSGIAAHVANIRSWSEATAMGREGSLLESWVVAELRALARLTAGHPALYFWRTSAGVEVDVVLEQGEAVVAVEIKGSATATAADLRGLRALRADLGPRFHLGILAYLGEAPQVLDDRLCLLPLASLLGAVT